MILSIKQNPNLFHYIVATFVVERSCVITKPHCIYEYSNETALPTNV